MANTKPSDAFHGDVQSSAASENYFRRVELAAAYRAMEYYGMHGGGDTHITALAPAADNSGRELMLVVPEGLHWSQLTPTSLLGIDEQNEVVEGNGKPTLTALCLHRGVRTKHNHLAVLHAHPPYTAALSCLEDQTVLPVHQTYLLFENRIAYDKDFVEIGTSIDGEGARLGRMLGDKVILLMGSHGCVTCGDSVAIALHRAYHLERHVTFQMIAMSTGQPLREISPEVITKEQDFVNKYLGITAQSHLNSFIRMYAKTCPEFENYDFTRGLK